MMPSDRAIRLTRRRPGRSPERNLRSRAFVHCKMHGARGSHYTHLSICRSVRLASEFAAMIAFKHGVAFEVRLRSPPVRMPSLRFSLNAFSWMGRLSRFALDLRRMPEANFNDAPRLHGILFSTRQAAPRLRICARRLRTGFGIRWTPESEIAADGSVAICRVSSGGENRECARKQGRSRRLSVRIDRTSAACRRCRQARGRGLRALQVKHGRKEFAGLSSAWPRCRAICLVFASSEPTAKFTPWATPNTNFRS